MMQNKLVHQPRQGWRAVAREESKSGCISLGASVPLRRASARMAKRVAFMDRETIVIC